MNWKQIIWDFIIYTREFSFCKEKADVGIFKALAEWMNEALLSEKLIWEAPLWHEKCNQPIINSCYLSHHTSVYHSVDYLMVWRALHYGCWMLQRKERMGGGGGGGGDVSFIFSLLSLLCNHRLFLQQEHPFPTCQTRSPLWWAALISTGADAPHSHYTIITTLQPLN